MTARNEGSNPQNQPSTVTVDVLRVNVGQTLHLLCLSPTIKGLFTHWLNKRSQYCDPLDCSHCKKGIDQIWKGYVAAKLYLPVSKQWRHVVFEITERCEVCMRLQYRAGQVWEVHRPVKTKKDQAPAVVAKLLEQRAGHDAPAWDVVPVLRVFYHNMGLQLSVENPRPLPMALPLESDAPPAVRGQSQPSQERASPDAMEKAKEWMRRQGIPIPESPNGKGPAVSTVPRHEEGELS